MMLSIFANEGSIDSGQIYCKTMLSTRFLVSEELRQKAISEIISSYKATDETIPPLQILENLLLSCNEIYDEKTFRQLTTSVLFIFLEKYNNKNMAKIKEKINSILSVCITYPLVPKKRYNKRDLKKEIVELVAQDFENGSTSREMSHHSATLVKTAIK